MTINGVAHFDWLLFALICALALPMSLGYRPYQSPSKGRWAPLACLLGAAVCFYFWLQPVSEASFASKRGDPTGLIVFLTPLWLLVVVGEVYTYVVLLRACFVSSYLASATPWRRRGEP